ncbi:MAG TPA: rRNA adenine N-6-methyltransferase family protein [Nitrososphaerales archaeon]|nr:rRNA adenine N-6-methyltransferase family protein [Nitrososphaerales archaeon]
MTHRSLGQHYLVDQSVIAKLVSLAGIRTGERVLEIGTGRGAVTRELARVASSLEGYEIDEENLRMTKEAVGGRRVRLRLGDAFERRPNFDVLVASLPYSRSSSFVEWISQRRYGRAVVILQEDFVRKVAARPGERDYRAISVIAQVSSEISQLGRVPRDSFSPQPRVNSVIVAWRPRRRLRPDEIAAVKRLFSLRRRQVSAAVAELGGRSPEDLGTKRVNSLSPEEALALASSL